MSVLHIGTATTLATVLIAGINNNDVAYIWLNSYTRKMVFDSTSTDATDTTNHPYYIRPNDYSTGGVWIEDVGADQYPVWSGEQIVTGSITSTNWAAAAGSQYDLDAGTIKLGGSVAPAFSVTAAGVLTATGAIISGTLTAVIGTIGGWTLGATSLVSTNIGLHSGANAEILLGHATTYASAKIGLKNDGSGKLANGNISWTAAGVLTQVVADGGDVTINQGADLIMAGGSAGDPSIIRLKSASLPNAMAEIRFEHSSDSTAYFGAAMMTTTSGGGTVYNYQLYIGPSAELVDDAGSDLAWIHIGESYTGQTADHLVFHHSIAAYFENGPVGIAASTPLAQLHIDQPASGGAKPVLLLDQADISEEFIKFIGLAANGVLTQSIVDEGDQASETRAGWLKVYVQDDGNQITDQAYFIPIYTLSA